MNIKKEVLKWLKISAAPALHPGDDVTINNRAYGGKQFIVDSIDTTKNPPTVTVKAPDGRVIPNIDMNLVQRLDNLHTFQDDDYVIYRNNLWRYEAATNSINLINKNTLMPIPGKNLIISATMLKEMKEVSPQEIQKIKGNLANQSKMDTIPNGTVIAYDNAYWRVFRLRGMPEPYIQKLDETLTNGATPAEFEVLKHIPANQLRIVKPVELAKLKSTQNHRKGDRVIITDTKNNRYTGIIDYIDNGDIILKEDNGNTVGFESKDIARVDNFSTNRDMNNGDLYVKLTAQSFDKLLKGVTRLAKQSPKLSKYPGYVNTISKNMGKVVAATPNKDVAAVFGSLGPLIIPIEYLEFYRYVGSRWIKYDANAVATTLKGLPQSSSVGVSDGLSQAINALIGYILKPTFMNTVKNIFKSAEELEENG